MRNRKIFSKWEAETSKRSAVPSGNNRLADFFSDFENFYDSIAWGPLIDAALALDFPLEVFALALLAYSAPRFFVVVDAAGPWVQPANSVLAGCFAGVDMARMLLHALLDYQHRQFRPRELAEQVDDVAAG